MRGKTLFLDRDGVINVRNFDGYILNCEEFHFLPNVIHGLQSLASLFDRIIIVTNQQCIGKNIITRSNLDRIHRYMLDMMENEGVIIAEIFVAENLRGEEPDRRKPAIAMGMEAKAQFPSIDFSQSLMVGDTDTDIRFGKQLGMKTALVKSPEVCSENPDYLVEDLMDLYRQLTQK
jgi:histidinol-phosphate phosphatase family protein